jgi:hypothetical protein
MCASAEKFRSNSGEKLGFNLRKKQTGSTKFYFM